ncbi:MAG TPA: BON domain-containing protein [Terriglobales bacterium]|nr:BON domain-containing protein [Terriglobales bacterium]
MMRRKRYWLLLLLVGAMALPLLAQSTNSTPAMGNTQDARSTGGGKYDQQIQSDINKYLQGRSQFQGVHATVEDGVVTLTGNVNRLIDKLDAEKKAHSIDHVQGVRDEIQVQSNVSDDDLRKKLAERLRYDRVGYGVAYNALSIDVQNGIVTVSGSVHDYPSRDSALAIIETTPGVKGVIDNITVQPTSPFDDDLRIRLAQAIYGHPALQRYAMDPQAPIRIVVENGHVTLYGVVDSQMDKQIAETQAKSVPGVFSVDDKLVVAGENKQK